VALGSSTSTLKSDIETAYNDAKEAGSEDGADPGAVIAALAEGVAQAIHDYFLTATVTTEVTIDTGQSDTAGGSTTNDGSGSGIGDPDSGTGGLT